jgi:hypothetical protein
MLKTIAGLLALTVALAAVGIAIWWLLGREMALGRWLLGALLVAHGLIHLLFAVPRPATAAATSGAAKWPFDMTRSWLVAIRGLDVSALRLVGVALVGTVVISLLLAGFATVGILVPSAWWPVLVVASSVASAVLFALFFDPQLVLGLSIDIVLLWIVLATVWAPAIAPTV